MRVLEYTAGATPRQWGQQHGEMFRGEVRALTAIRTYLCTRVGTFPDRASVLAAAEVHLPILERYHAGLYDELLGIAEGSGLTPADIVICNHYTDLRDLSPDPTSWRPAPIHADSDGGCSVIWAETPTGRILAQTWDMHASAIPYVMMLHVPATAETPAAWLFTLTGCLGLTGMNTARLAIGINNLNSLDATLGVVWPALVRRALHLPTAAAARHLILSSPIGSGHHYFVADLQDAFAIETSGTLRASLPVTSPYCHTNHCLSPSVAAVSTITPTSTTLERYAWLTSSLETPPTSLADIWTRMGNTDGWPNSVCTNTSTPENPHGTATCGAIAMNLSTHTVIAEAGLINHVQPSFQSGDRFMGPNGS